MPITLDPAPTRDAAGAPSWVRWFNQLYAAVQNILTGGTLTTLTLSGATTFTNPEQIVFGAGWQNWTPAFAGLGAMTISSLRVLNAKYVRLGPLVLFNLRASFTLGGTASNYLSATLPVPMVGDYSALTTQIWPSGAAQASTHVGQVDAVSHNLMFLFLNGAPNYPLGSTVVTVSGCYQCG